MRRIVLIALLTSCNPAAPPQPTPLSPPVLPDHWQGPTELQRAHVVAVGDLLMHTNVKNSAKAAMSADNHDGFGALFEHVDTWIKQSDVAFANLETPVAPKSHRATASMVFNVSPSLLPALKETGFDVLSFANNHVYDQGRNGFIETMENLNSSGMTWIGGGATCDDARAAKLLEVNGLKIAWIATSKVYNDNLNTEEDTHCSFELDVSQALDSAAAARRAGAEFVVLSAHWGHEYKTAPHANEVKDARALMDGGIDVVLGHHPHVVQPVEIRKTPDGRIGVTAYSLGNFISNQRYDYVHGVQPLKYGNPRDGLALEFDIVRKDYGPGPDGVRQIRTEVANVTAVPIWTDNDAMRIVHPAPTIRAIRLSDAITQTHTKLAAATDPDASLLLKKRLAMLEDRWTQVANIIGEGLMQPHPLLSQPSQLQEAPK